MNLNLLYSEMQSLPQAKNFDLLFAIQIIGILFDFVEHFQLVSNQ